MTRDERNRAAFTLAVASGIVSACAEVIEETPGAAPKCPPQLREAIDLIDAIAGAIADGREIDLSGLSVSSAALSVRSAAPAGGGTSDG